MKTIKDLTTADINVIYSIIIGKEKTVGKIDWTPERDYVIAVFKVEDCIDERFDTVEMGISINAELEIDHFWHYKKSGSVSISHEPLHNHHAITKYLIDEGFDVALPSELTTLRSRVKELEESKEAKRIELGNYLAETIAENLMGMRDAKEFSKEWAMCAGKKSLAESILIKFT